MTWLDNRLTVRVTDRPLYREFGMLAEAVGSRTGTGLLAVVATICLIGTVAAAIRVILVQYAPGRPAPEDTRRT